MNELSEAERLEIESLANSLIALEHQYQNENEASAETQSKFH